MTFLLAIILCLFILELFDVFFSCLSGCLGAIIKLIVSMIIFLFTVWFLLCAGILGWIATVIIICWLIRIWI